MWRAGHTTVFGLNTLKVIQTVKTGKNSDAVLYEPVTRRVFVVNGRSNDATVIGAGKPEFGVVDGKDRVFVKIEDTSELCAGVPAAGVPL